MREKATGEVEVDNGSGPQDGGSTHACDSSSTVAPVTHLMDGRGLGVCGWTPGKGVSGAQQAGRFGKATHCVSEQAAAGWWRLGLSKWSALSGPMGGLPDSFPRQPAWPSPDSKTR